MSKTTNKQEFGLVGLWAIIRDESGKCKRRVFIYGEAGEGRYLVQAVSALDGSPNVIRIASVEDMVGWTFYSSSELMDEEVENLNRTGKLRYTLEIGESDSTDSNGK